MKKVYKIVVVDNNENTLKEICDFIYRYFDNTILYQYVSAHEAFEKISANKDIDIVIIDFSMEHTENIEMIIKTNKIYHPKIVVICDPINNFELIYPKPYLVPRPVNLHCLKDVLNEIINKVTGLDLNNVDEEDVLLVENMAKNMLSELHTPFKLHLFLRKVFITLVFDTDEKSPLYKKLSNKMDVPESTIKSSIKKVIDSIDISMMKNFGFSKMPTNIEFLNKITGMIKSEVVEEKKTKRGSNR